MHVFTYATSDQAQHIIVIGKELLISDVPDTKRTVLRVRDSKIYSKNNLILTRIVPYFSMTRQIGINLHEQVV